MTNDIDQMRKSTNKKIAISFVSSLLIGILGTRSLVFFSQFRFFNRLNIGMFIVVMIFMLCCALLVAWWIEKQILGRFFITISIFVLSALVFIISFFFVWSDTMNF